MPSPPVLSLGPAHLLGRYDNHSAHRSHSATERLQERLGPRRRPQEPARRITAASLEADDPSNEGREPSSGSG